MFIFGWVAGRQELPPQWDLRRLGWSLSAAGSANDVCLVDMREMPLGLSPHGLTAGADLARCVFLGVDSGLERARLLDACCGDALSLGVELPELGQRAARLAALCDCLPRRREIGPLTLDLLHRDARAGKRWLALHPREFELLWRLSERPGERVSRTRLLREVWRLEFEPGTNSVEVHVSRLRAKLAAAGAGGMVETDPLGGYRVGRAEQVEVAFAQPFVRRLCAQPNPC